MKTTILFLGFILLAFFAFTQDNKPVNPAGLSIEYGIGSVAITDYYVSKERYTGSLPYVGFWYGRLNHTKGFNLGLTYQSGDELKNYNIRASLSRVSLNFDQYFLVKEFKLFSDPVHWYIGPSVEYFEYELANYFTSNHKSFSELNMATLGFNSLLNWQISKRFNASLFLRTNVISANFKTHDERKFRGEDSKLQTLFVSNNLNMDLNIQYKILKRLSAGIKIKAEYTRSTGWDKSVQFTNSVLVYLIIHF